MNCSGMVVEERGPVAAVRIESGSCGECRACGFGAIKNRKAMEVYASNEVGAKRGDTVTLEVSDRKIVGSSAILFLIPLTAFAIGIILGYFPLWYLFGVARVPIALICGFALVGGSFYVVHMLGGRREFEFSIRSAVAGHRTTVVDSGEKTML